MPADPIQERKGVAAVELSILREFGWLFREQPISDYGIDAQIEEVVEGTPTGKLVALQIKSGPSFFRARAEGYVFYGERRHLQYWTNHSLPVFIILHNPDSGLTLWQKVDAALVIETENGWSIDIPKENVLNASAKIYFERALAATPEAKRRFRMAAELDTIKLFMEQDDIYFALNEWVNKTINMREVGVRFADPYKDKFDLTFPYVGGHYTVFEFMSEAFPWLDYEHLETEEALGGEVEVHSLIVTVNELGKAFVALEDFYANGQPEREEPEFHGVVTDALSENEEQEWAMRRAMERDPWK